MKVLSYASIFYKKAQDYLVDNPNVTVQPGSVEVNCAVDILQQWDSNYFSGVSKINVAPSAQYGHVESGPDKDPSVININGTRILNESGGSQAGKKAILATALVIAHERGHVRDFAENGEFKGGEAVADAEEQAFKQWLQNNVNNLNVPCFNNAEQDENYDAWLQSFLYS